MRSILGFLTVVGVWLGANESRAERCGNIVVSSGSLKAFPPPADAWADCETTKCPQLKRGPYTFVFFADNDNELEVIVVGYLKGKQAFRVDAPGARYVKTVALDCTAQTVKLVGATGTASIAMADLPGAPPGPPKVTSARHAYCNKDLTGCPISGGGRLFVEATGLTEDTKIKGASGSRVLVRSGLIHADLPTGRPGATRRLTLANQRGESAPIEITYASAPVITGLSMSGCASKDKTLYDCPNTPGATLTITGNHLAGRVFPKLEGAPCELAWKDFSMTKITCRYTGKPGALFLSTNGGNARLQVELHALAPAITTVTHDGRGCTHINNRLQWCPGDGGSTLTFKGNGFTTDARFEGALCARDSIKRVDNTTVTCTLSKRTVQTDYFKVTNPHGSAMIEAVAR